MSLPSLPFDVLFAVFRDLDVVDVVRIGMTCKVIREAAQERHVWIDQLEKLRRENPIFKLATPPLASLATRELKTLVTGRAKLRLRLNDDHDDLGFTRKGMTIIPENCNLHLLPGGKYLIVVQFDDIITLHRIELEDDQVSLPVSTHIDSDSYFWSEPCSELLTTTSPCPMLVFGSFYEHTFFIYRLDHHNGAMILETTFRMPNGYRPLGADGQGRVIGFVVQNIDHNWLPRAIVIHLDHPDTVMESDIHPSVYHTRWKISIPTEGLLVIYNDESILACKIPNFSSSPPGVHLMNLAKMWSRPGIDQHMYMTSEPVHDPLSAREFNLYFSDTACYSKIVTVTIPIGASDGKDDDPSPQSDGLPVLEQTTTFVEEQNTVPDGTYFIQRGLYARPMKIDGGSLFRVVPLKGLASHGPKVGLRFSVSDEELGNVELYEPEKVQIDEATGRVVIGKWLGDGQGVKILVGDLV